MPFGMFFNSFLLILKPFGRLGSPLGDFWSTFAALGLAFETFVGLWASWVALGRICKVSGEFLIRFSTFLHNFNEFSVIFLFYCSQCSKMVGYGRIW